MEDTFHFGIKALITNSNGEILLLKINSAMLKIQKEPYWDLPGGRIKKGESIEQTLLREIEEEIGINKMENIIEVGIVLSNIRIPTKDSDVGLFLGIYNCKIKNNSVIKLSTEHTEYKWFRANEASELLQVKYPKSFTDIVANL